MIGEEFITSHGARVFILLDGDDAIVHTAQGEEIGRIQFRTIEYEDGSELRLIHMSLERVSGYRGKGIGRECLVRMSQHTGLTIVAAEIGTGELADGSHLIGDGPGFVTKMRSEGIIAPTISDYVDREIE